MGEKIRGVPGQTVAVQKELEAAARNAPAVGDWNRPE